jgi:hypothetical protein
MSFTHAVRKGKLTVTEGSSGFKITFKVDLRKLNCQCINKSNKTVKKNNEICPHIKYYLIVLGVVPLNIPLLTVSRVREWLLEYLSSKSVSITDTDTGHTINTYCSEFLSEDEGCCICLGAYTSLRDLYQCPQCNEPYHQKCYARWQKDCPRCKYVRDINQGKDDGDWPTLPQE